MTKWNAKSKQKNSSAITYEVGHAYGGAYALLAAGSQQGRAWGSSKAALIPINGNIAIEKLNKNSSAAARATNGAKC